MTERPARLSREIEEVRVTPLARRSVEKSAGLRWRDRLLLAYARSFGHPFKVRFVRWLARNVAAGRVLVRHAGDAVIAIDPADYIGWAIVVNGSYEPASLDLALRLMRAEPGLFVDVGANVGWYTCAVAACAGCRVISIEPDCASCTALRRNVELGGLANVAVFNGAVGSRFGVVRAVPGAPGNSGAVAVHAARRGSSISGDWVATIPLEALLNQAASPPARPVLVKIDVEGFEREVLAGLALDGPFRPKNILLEFDKMLSAASWRSFDDLRAFLSAKGYDVLDVLGQPLTGPSMIVESNVWARERAPG